MRIKQTFASLFACVLFLGLTGCGEQGKIDAVKSTIIPKCEGKTMQDLAAGLLQSPVWGYEETTAGKKYVTLTGTIAGDKLPEWVKKQNIMDASFRFELDPKTDAFDPTSLDGLPSLTSPEGIFQAYKALTCS